MLSIDLNGDMGEGFPNDALIFPYISSVNIACGYHAGDKKTMQQTVAAAIKHQVAIGAHPSYPDRENFGRNDILHTKVRIADLAIMVQEQIVLLQEICRVAGVPLHHVKPHGALYNRAAWDEEAAACICSAIQLTNPELLLYGLSGSAMEKTAARFQLRFVHEVFADRTYQHDGSLTPRKEPNAVIHDVRESLDQVMTMIGQGIVQTVQGTIIPIRAETICIHGDSPEAVSFAATIHGALRDNDITIRPPAPHQNHLA